MSDNSEEKIKTGAPDEYQVRLERLNKWKSQKINPYPSKALRDHTAAECRNDFDNLAVSAKSVTVAGRIRARRLHGGSCFMSLEDSTGQIQIYGKQDMLGDSQYERFSEWLDVGDFIQASGTMFKTKTEEPTVQIKEFTILTKTLSPLPEKWHGLHDIEQRYRYRHLDLLANPQAREIFSKRTKIIRTIRNFLDDLGFSEVDTPILQTIASGATARPFVTHHDALDMDMFLRVAPELFLKRLLIGGYEKVYEVARCFRNEGIDYAHNPEFTQVELYWAYADYEDLMKLTEDLLTKLVTEVNNSTELEINGHKVNFKAPYERLDFAEAFKKFAGINIDKIKTAEDLAKEAHKKHLEISPEWGRGKLLDQMYKEFIRPNLIQPTFIINHPVDLSPLAKQIDDRPSYTQRMQLVAGGRLELTNAFTELNDPAEQAARFKEQKALLQKGDDEAMASDESFVEALKYGMPPAAGLGLGIDRLVAMLCGQSNLKEVILFPTLRSVAEKEDEKDDLI